MLLLDEPWFTKKDLGDFMDEAKQELKNSKSEQK